MRILIVEDEKRAKRGLHNIIESISADYEIIAEASNGSDALEVIKVLKPDVVLTDIRMPIMDGLELIRRAKEVSPGTKYVIISAYEEFDYAKEAVSLGVSEYLVKPLVREEIVETLQKLSQGELRQETELYSLVNRYQGVHPIIMKALKKIESDYVKPINQKDLAGELGVSQEYFSNLFSKSVGVPFSRFLRNYRIDVAKILYLHGETDRREIPYQVGFTDEKYFNRVFREVAGVSVATFLQEHKSLLK